MPSQIVLPQQNRQGTVVSPSFTVPQVTESVAIVELLVSPADMNDPATQVTARFLSSADNGVTWNMEGGGAWTGGVSTEKNGAARQWRQLLNDPGKFAGLLARVELDLPTTTRIGVRVTV